MKLFNAFLIVVLLAGCGGKTVSIDKYNDVLEQLEAQKSTIAEMSTMLEAANTEAVVLEKKYGDCLKKLPKEKKPGFLRRKLQPLGRILKGKNNK